VLELWIYEENYIMVNLQWNKLPNEFHKSFHLVQR